MKSYIIQFKKFEVENVVTTKEYMETEFGEKKFTLLTEEIVANTAKEAVQKVIKDNNISQGNIKNVYEKKIIELTREQYAY